MKVSTVLTLLGGLVVGCGGATDAPRVQSSKAGEGGAVAPTVEPKKEGKKMGAGNAAGAASVGAVESSQGSK